VRSRRPAASHSSVGAARQDRKVHAVAPGGVPRAHLPWPVTYLSHVASLLSQPSASYRTQAARYDEALALEPLDWHAQMIRGLVVRGRLSHPRVEHVAQAVAQQVDPQPYDE